MNLFRDLVSVRIVAKLLLDFVLVPLQFYPSICTILENEECSDGLTDFIASMPYLVRRSIALAIARGILIKETTLQNIDHITRVLSDWLGTLVRDQKDGGFISGKIASNDTLDAEEWRSEQILLARLIQQFRDSSSPDQQFLVRSFHAFLRCADNQLFRY